MIVVARPPSGSIRLPGPANAMPGTLALLAGVVAALAVGLNPGRGVAESCPIEQDRLVAGHSLPLDATPTPQSIHLDRAFPALSFAYPVGLETPPDATDRLFVVEQGGRIWVFQNRDDVPTRTLFLDIAPLLSFGGERGLLGLAFDPDYATNRRFYLDYVARSPHCQDPGASLCTKIVRYEASADDPDVADPTSAHELLDFTQPYGNHNGGALAFGPDGMLYVAAGDGGSAGDPHGNAQDTSTRLGAILRLDVRDGADSIVPADNPLVGDPEADPLVFHWGLRNPWRISFDRGTGDLLIADVGQNRREEVHRVRAGTPGGLNFGWNACEGTRDFDGPCTSVPSIPPVIEYAHDTPEGGHIIIGGYVYRGSAIPELVGSYLFADAASMNLWAWDGRDPADPWNPGNPGVLLANTGVDLSSFGEDQHGELYAVSISTGFVYRLVRDTGGSGFPRQLSQTGLFSDTAGLVPAPGLVEYAVTSPGWSDGAIKRRWMALPGSAPIHFRADGAWSFPIGTAFVKHFSLPRSGGGERRVSTRILVRQNAGWVGVTYRWNATSTDAALVTTAADETIDLGGGSSQLWHFPSSNECVACHTAASGHVLGVRTRQLHDAVDYPPHPGFPGGSVPQLEAWNCAGLFDIDIRDPGRYPRSFALDDSAARRIDRARSYLATNCEMCHQPQGTAPSELDLRFTRGVGQWHALDMPVGQGDLRVPDARLIAPGDRTRSMLWLRQQTTDVATRMAPGTLLPDGQAIELIGDWIDLDMDLIDSDGDGVADPVDGCPTVPDSTQSDRDADGLGDACDPDDLPDLFVRSFRMSSIDLVEGAPLSLEASVVNRGLADTGDFPVGFFLSKDRRYDPDDIPVDHCWIEAVPSGQAGSCERADARVPVGLLEGELEPATYHLGACANLSGVVSDGNPSNDCLVSPTRITVPEPASAPLRAIGVAALLVLASSRRRNLLPPGRR